MRFALLCFALHIRHKTSDITRVHVHTKSQICGYVDLSIPPFVFPRAPRVFKTITALLSSSSSLTPVSNLDILCHTGHARLRQRKQVPITRQRHPRILRHRHRHGARLIAARCRCQRDPPLVRIDRMRRAAEPDQRVLRHRWPRCGDAQLPAGGHLARADDVDDGSVRGRAVGVVEVGRAVDLAVGVVGGAAVAAEAAPAVEDRSVGEEEAGGVVVAGDGDGCHLGEGLGGRVPHFRDQLRGLVGEADGEVLASGDEDFAVGQYDAVVKGAREGHGVDGGDFRGCVGFGERNDVGIGGGVRVYLR